MMSPKSDPVLIARVEINAPLQDTRRWFLDLSDHPERYEFESHEGFTFTEGAFGETGAKFRTQEHFMGVTQTLKFTLTEVEEHQFTFQLRQPIREIWGRFVLNEITPNTTELRLEIGGNTQPKRILLKMPVISQAVRSQIRREVEHIKQSVERTRE
jgi:hypothetical protein